MQLAISTISDPPLTSFSLADVKTSMASLKAANVDVADIWFLVTKRPSLLSLADALQRWLDFLAMYGLSDKDLTNCLLRAPQRLFDECTIFEAGQVINFLKGLGLKDDFLAQRVFGVWPDVLSRDVESELRPVVTFLMALGLEVRDIAHMIGLWPELLLASVPGQLEPFAAYLRDLGCTNAQLVQVLTLCPHLLGFKLDDLFGHRLSTLGLLGVSREDVRAMVNSSVAWLTSSGGIQAQVDVLLHDMGCSHEEARTLVMACPDILAQKDTDLVRTWHFIMDELEGDLSLVLAVPKVLAGAGLMQTLGPRVTFLKVNGMAHLLRPPAGDDSSSRAPPEPPLALHALTTLGDEDWCSSVNLPLGEFREHSVQFQTDFTERITNDAAKEFQDELRKLGIYEGTE